MAFNISGEFLYFPLRWLKLSTYNICSTNFRNVYLRVHLIPETCVQDPSVSGNSIFIDNILEALDSRIVCHERNCESWTKCNLL